jgi:hypothetical protein
LLKLRFEKPVLPTRQVSWESGCEGSKCESVSLTRFAS